MIRCDYHVHTRFCDGNSTPEEVVQAALSLEMTRLGFSAHSYVPYDAGGCLTAESTPAYRAEIIRLREVYRDRIQIFLGVEQDYESGRPREDWDFVIGSVHCLPLGDGYVPLDHKAQILLGASQRFFGGDILSLCEAYYEKVGGIVEQTGCNLIGHFDLITKFLEQTPLFDVHHPRYVAAWQRAADRLLPWGIPFEVNTGAMSRGYRTAPYPAPEILQYLRDRGGTFVLSGDSHRAGDLCWDFDAQEERLLQMGISVRTELPPIEALWRNGQSKHVN